MQTTVMSEGLLLNSKYVKMGRGEGGFHLEASLHSLPNKLIATKYCFLILGDDTSFFFLIISFFFFSFLLFNVI